MARLEKIKELIAVRAAAENKFNARREEAYKRWMAPEVRDIYSRDYITSRIDDELTSISDSEQKTFSKLNELLKEEVAKVRDSLKAKYYPPFNKTSDTQVANALTLINTIGPEITEEDCITICGPFADDYVQTQSFQRVIGLLNKNLLNCKAFTKANIYTQKLEELNSATEIARSLFINPRLVSDGQTFNGRYFVTAYYDTYSELNGRTRLVELVEKIEEDTLSYID